jgi:hypothetical protein
MNNIFQVAMMVVAFSMLPSCSHVGGDVHKGQSLSTTQKSFNLMGGMSAKRVGPPNITPLIIDDIRVEAVHWGKEKELGQNGGYIVAYNNTTNEELWLLKVYHVEYDGVMEEDVQDIFIKSIIVTAMPKTIKIVNEKGKSFLVDIGNKRVKEE